MNQGLVYTTNITLALLINMWFRRRDMGYAKTLKNMEKEKNMDT